VAISYTSIAVPFLLGAALALVLHPRLSGSEVPIPSFALFVAVAMSVTAFPVLSRILTDRGIQRTRLGTVALGCAAINDVMAWCLLAFVVGIAQAKLSGGFVVLGLTIVFIGTLILVVRPLARRFLNPLDEDGVTPGVIAVVLGALLMSALATEAIG